MILNNITELHSTDCLVIEGNFEAYQNNPHRFDAGAIFLCLTGSVTITVNLDIYTLVQGSIFCLFPRDILAVKECTNDFSTKMILMSAELMGEASTRLEHIIFDKLHSNPLIETEAEKIKSFFMNTTENIEIYASTNDTFRSKDFFTLQIRSLFLVLASYIKRQYSNDVPRTYSRLEEHFKIFLAELTHSYKMSREVSFYANKMSITPKYLNYIVQSVAHRTCKSLIDAYIIMQIKLELRNTEKAVQEVAYEYNFPNQSFLGSYFKKYVGMSPRSFRNEK